jgi:hypothetical protein
MTISKRIRDFVYLDTFRVRSLASQVNEGLAESRRIQHAGIHETGSTVAQDVSAATTELRLTEDRLLLDHIYNEFEDGVSPMLLTKGIPLDIKNSPLIKVSGTVEIEDYKQLTEYMERYNDLGKMIAFSTLEGKEKFSTDKQRENALTAHAKNVGLAQDPMLLRNLCEFVKLFNTDAFNILFNCQAESGYQVRAVVNRQCLRYTDDFLRGLYAGASIVPWTMVGIATYAPSDEVPEQPSAASEQPIEEMRFKDGTPNMALMYRNMFRQSRFLANTFSRSLGNEIVALPLAIYREFSLEATSGE